LLAVIELVAFGGDQVIQRWDPKAKAPGSRLALALVFELAELG
jgi:hypothetical protein